MSATAPLPAPADEDRVARCPDLGSIVAAARSDADLLVWQRRLPADLIAWLDTLDPAAIPDDRLLLRPSDFRKAVTTLMVRHGLTDRIERTLLIEDMADLVDAFARITGADAVDVRLEHVRHDACWKFHRDRVNLRLLCTYRGPASQWVHPDDSDAALRDQKDFSGQIHRLSAGDVALFRGNTIDPDQGIVHRSPPIAGTGVSRLLLCLNTPSAVSPDLWSG